MNIALAVGVCFVGLACVFGLAALADYRGAQRQVTPAVKARRRVAVIFAVVGLALVSWQLTRR